MGTSISTIPDMKYHADDWGIVSKMDKDKERIEGLKYLSSSSFPGCCVEWYYFSHILENINEIDSFLKNRWFFVVIASCNFYRKILLVNSANDLKKKLKGMSVNYESEDTNFLFINMIQKCENCCAGVVLSDGERNLRIEIMPNSVNTRDLTDGTKDSNKMIYLENHIISLKLLSGSCNSFVLSNDFSVVIKELVKCCYNRRGYYEFIYGSDQIFDSPNVFFTYNSLNERYGFENLNW